MGRRNSEAGVLMREDSQYLTLLLPTGGFVYNVCMIRCDEIERDRERESQVDCHLYRTRHGPRLFVGVISML